MSKKITLKEINLLTGIQSSSKEFLNAIKTAHSLYITTDKRKKAYMNDKLHKGESEEYVDAIFKKGLRLEIQKARHALDFFYNLIKCCDTELPDHLDIEEFVKRKSKI